MLWDLIKQLYNYIDEQNELSNLYFTILDAHGLFLRECKKKTIADAFRKESFFKNKILPLPPSKSCVCEITTKNNFILIKPLPFTKNINEKFIFLNKKFKLFSLQ